MPRNLNFKIGAAILSLCLVFVPSALAFMYPLQSTSVREAYFLGRAIGSQQLTDFLAPYIHRFPLPSKGPHVESIEFRTPYEQVVVRSRDGLSGQGAQQAMEDYAAHPGLVVVRVLIHYTPPYPSSSTTQPATAGGLVYVRGSDDFWPGFHFRVAQEHAIEPKKVSSRSLHIGRNGPSGTEVTMEFDATQFASSAATVEVTTPAGQTLTADFDLDKLK